MLQHDNTLPKREVRLQLLFMNVSFSSSGSEVGINSSTEILASLQAIANGCDESLPFVIASLCMGRLAVLSGPKAKVLSRPLSMLCRCERLRRLSSWAVCSSVLPRY